MGTIVRHRNDETFSDSIVVRSDNHQELFKFIDEDSSHIEVQTTPVLATLDANTTIDKYAQYESIVDDEISEYRKVATIPRAVTGTNDKKETVNTVNNPLKWWSRHEYQFPVIAHLARKILCIPAISASVERLFSTAGLTIVQERARLSPELAEDIIFLHDVWPVIDKFVAEDKIINID